MNVFQKKYFTLATDDDWISLVYRRLEAAQPGRQQPNDEDRLCINTNIPGKYIENKSLTLTLFLVMTVRHC